MDFTNLGYELDSLCELQYHRTVADLIPPRRPFEPKAHVIHCGSMAMKRAASEGPNPFWSKKAQAELELQSARPADLPFASCMLPPVPPDGDWELDEKTPGPLQGWKQPIGSDRGRQNERGKGTSDGAAFRTPPSGWIRSEGSRDEKSRKSRKSVICSSPAP